MSRKLIPYLMAGMFLSLSAFPNASQFPGYYISNIGESVRCTIDFGDYLWSA